jgi:GNAT superfamily N-acetyltransferase
VIGATTLTGDHLGCRVVVRYRLSARPLSTDVLGVLVALDDSGLRVLTAAGEVVPVAYDTVVAARPVPPWRYHDQVDDLELERICALNWPAVSTRRLGGWLMRAARGWTGRANSVLTLGDPGMPLDEALRAVTAWYSGQGLTPTVQVPLPARAALAAGLAERGWRDVRGALVQTAPLAEVLRTVGPTQVPAQPTAALPPVTLETAPDEQWLAHYSYRGTGSPPPHGMAVLTGGTPLFAAARDGGTTIAIARITVDEGWVGLGAVEVDPAHRRRGLATHLLRVIAEHGLAAGADSIWLQTWPENTAAITLYARAGFRTHHTYRYYRPS